MSDVAALESLRGQALRMVHNWVAELEALQATGQHSMDIVRELSDRKKRRVWDITGNRNETARGTETRRGGRRDMYMREMSPEARRTDRIMRHVRECGPLGQNYFDALRLRADLPSITELADAMNRSKTDSKCFFEAGIAIFMSCLILKQPA